ncbi:hypothetical protein [Streptomyces phaeochromogenes]|uniref:hypothetical protein n=1 Tax=Streptomyces phaeochromogenes TaxID=1923 RepID=UPI00386C8FA1|nr:hypothetical protein OHB08_00570 [Streptomyces phaeochromogenes]
MTEPLQPSGRGPASPRDLVLGTGKFFIKDSGLGVHHTLQIGPQPPHRSEQFGCLLTHDRSAARALLIGPDTATQGRVSR